MTTQHGEGTHTRFRLCELRVRNFRSCRDVTLTVEPDITILVGLNDTGKTALLEALRVYGAIVADGFDRVVRKSEIAQATPPVELEAAWEDRETGQRYQHLLVADPADPREHLRWDGAECVWSARTRALQCDGRSYPVDMPRYVSLGTISLPDWRAYSDVPDEVAAVLARVSQFAAPPPFRLEPSALSQESPLTDDEVTPTGFGWPGLLSEITNRRDGTVEALEEQAHSLFPFARRVRASANWSLSGTSWATGTASGDATITRADGTTEVGRLGAGSQTEDGGCPESESVPRPGVPPPSPRPDRERPAPPSTWGVQVEVPTGTGDGAAWVPAEAVSSGVLLCLAHLSIAHGLEPGSLVTLEEPENGLNLQIVLPMMESFLTTVRERKLQLIMTTHDPFWLDLVGTRCIRVATRDAKGTHVYARERNLSRIRKEGFHLSEIMIVGGPEELLRKRESL